MNLKKFATKPILPIPVPHNSSLESVHYLALGLFVLQYNCRGLFELDQPFLMPRFDGAILNGSAAKGTRTALVGDQVGGKGQDLILYRIRLSYTL